MAYKDIIYEKKDGIATITINRPDKYNAFTPGTVEELIKAMGDAAWDKSVGVIVLGGAGEKAFCTGGDQSIHDGDYGGRGLLGMPMEELHDIIRDAPKPVIARVQGWAIGGGNVLCTVCDFTICSENAKFGQAGPRVGSVDAGYGTGLLARIIGDKKAKEIWYLCRTYTGKEAVEMGLANVCVPNDKLDAEVAQWCKEILEKSPTAISIAKRSFHADTDNIRGIGGLAMQTVALYYQTDESKEGVNAFNEKRKANFRKFI